MNAQKLKRFNDTENFFRCPVCKSGLRLSESSLVCNNGHSFDIAKQGYVNLAMHQGKSEKYDKSTFEKRKLILESGFYDHIADRICGIVKDLHGVRSILDAGCGEGFYARRLNEALNINTLAFDLSKDSVLMAAKSDASDGIKWFVADLADIPLKDGAADCILNIFSPANYGEFRRILCDSGTVIKAVPSSAHLSELRAAAKGALKNQDYSNGDVLRLFEERFTLTHRAEVNRTFTLTEEQADAFIGMTPLLFGADRSAIDRRALRTLTVGAVLVAGKPKAL